MSRTINTEAVNVNPADEFFFHENFSAAIKASVQETLKEMCRLTCEFQDNFVAQKWLPIASCSATVEMKSDSHRAVLQLHFSDLAIMNLMSNMFGRAPLNMNNEVLDCVGSLTDVVYGRMRTLLNEQGYNFEMAFPKSFETAKLSHPRGSEIRHLVIPFKVANSQCFAQMMFQA